MRYPRLGRQYQSSVGGIIIKVFHLVILCEDLAAVYVKIDPVPVPASFNLMSFFLLQNKLIDETGCIQLRGNTKFIMFQERRILDPCSSIAWNS